MKIRRRPAVYDAIQWRGDNYAEVYAWLMAYGGGLSDPGIDRTSSDVLRVSEHDHQIVGCVNDWFIQGDSGKLFACPPVLFDSKYDRVHDDYVESGETFNFQRCRGCGHFLDECDCHNECECDQCKTSGK